MFIDVIFRPYYNIYGELFIDRDPENGKWWYIHLTLLSTLYQNLQRRKRDTL